MQSRKNYKYEGPTSFATDFATVESDLPMASQSIIATPNPVKLSSHFATDLNEAEQATLTNPIVQFNDTRTLSSSSASSNATTLVDKEYMQQELSPTEKRPFCDYSNNIES
jgi:hypothetical protein